LLEDEEGAGVLFAVLVLCEFLLLLLAVILSFPKPDFDESESVSAHGNTRLFLAGFDVSLVPSSLSLLFGTLLESARGAGGLLC
jgi:hypothetical protein